MKRKVFNWLNVECLQKSLFSLLWTPHVTGALALTFFKYHTPPTTPKAPAAETAVTVPAQVVPEQILLVELIW